MRHRRSDYEAIQPWPTKRPHIAKDDIGQTMEVALSGASGGTHPIIPDDEPVFLIRAQDAVGPDAVRAWADLAEQAGAAHHLVAAVFDWADEMAAYAAANGSKVPDAPSGVLERG